MDDFSQFIEPVNIAAFNEDEGFTDGQLAMHINTYEHQLPHLNETDIVLIGITDQRGNNCNPSIKACDVIKETVYRLQYWHKNIRISDMGNVKTGAAITDTYAALRVVISELLRLRKTIVLIGGSHDFTLAQYYAYKELGQLIEATVVDAEINLKAGPSLRSENFLMEMLTSEPNHVLHYNHIGFQSYLVHPRMLETIDKLRFDCYRVGVAKEDMEEMEPVIRSSHMLSFDIAAIKNSDAPASACSPNGFSGEEACLLARFGGLSPLLNTFGLYGYNADMDHKELTAKQIAQMMWYFVDGKSKSKDEAHFDDKHNFNEYNTVFSEVDTLFLQSKKSGRWWMQLPDKKMIACSYKDYSDASHNRIPERWLRAQERN